ncbi:MAG: hypothetical protein ACFUZC_00280 [Chthoniobacteraceae bacterium]
MTVKKATPHYVTLQNPLKQSKFNGMNHIFALSCLLLMCNHAGGSEPWYEIRPFGNPKIYKDGEWELRIYYVHKGDPDEGMNGDLRLQGKRLVPVMPPGYIRTPLGELTFFPAPKSLNRPNVVIGWTFRDFEMIPWTTVNHPVRPQRSDWHEEKASFTEPHR